MSEKVTGRNEVIQKLQEMTDEKGEQLIQKDIEKSDCITLYYITKYFDTFSRAKEVAGVGDSVTKENVEKVLHRYVEEHNEVPTSDVVSDNDSLPCFLVTKRLFGADSWDDLLREVGIDPDEIRRRQVITGLNKLSEEYNGSPPVTALKAHNEMPSYHTVERLFGSVEGAYKAAGLSYSA